MFFGKTVLQPMGVGCVSRQNSADCRRWSKTGGRTEATALPTVETCVEARPRHSGLNADGLTIHPQNTPHKPAEIEDDSDTERRSRRFGSRTSGVNWNSPCRCVLNTGDDIVRMTRPNDGVWTSFQNSSVSRKELAYNLIAANFALDQAPNIVLEPRLLRRKMRHCGLRCSVFGVRKKSLLPNPDPRKPATLFLLPLFSDEFFSGNAGGGGFQFVMKSERSVFDLFLDRSGTETLRTNPKGLRFAAGQG